MNIPLLGIRLVLLVSLLAPLPASAALTSPPVGESDAQTLTNKEIVPRVVALPDAATVTLNADIADMGVLQSLSQDTTIANPAGSHLNGQRVILRIRSEAVRLLSWGSAYTGTSGRELPAQTTGGGAVDYYVFHYNATNAKWEYTWASGGDLIVGEGGGDFLSTASTSVDSEVVLYAGTDGKHGKRGTGTGIATLTSGVLGSVAQPAGALVGDSAFQVLSNKEIIPRIVTLPDLATVLPNADTTDIAILTSLSQATTIANPEGTPENGQMLMLRMQSATAQPLLWGNAYAGTSAVDLPAATTGGGAVDYYIFYYNTSTGHWEYLSSQGSGVISGFETYTSATLPVPCTPHTYATVTDSDAGPLYICSETGDSWGPVVPSVSSTATVNLLPWRPTIASRDAAFTFDNTGTWWNIDATAGPVVGTLPLLSDTAEPGFFTTQIRAGTNCLTLLTTPPNIFRVIGTGSYPDLCGVQAGADIWRCSDNEWCVRPMTALAKRTLQWTVVAGKFPATGGPEPDQSTPRPSLLFDATTKECLSYQAEVPNDYLGNLEVFIKASMKTDTITTHTLGWGISLWAVRDGLNESVIVENYDTEEECSVTALPATVERPFTCRKIMGALDGLAVGDHLTARLCRLVAGKTSTGDARVLSFGLLYDWR